MQKEKKFVWGVFETQMCTHRFILFSGYDAAKSYFDKVKKNVLHYAVDDGYTNISIEDMYVKVEKISKGYFTEVRLQRLEIDSVDIE